MNDDKGNEMFFNFRDIKKIINIFLLFLFIGMPAKTMEKNFNDEILADALAIILSNLDAKDRCKSSLVCKKWFIIIDQQWDFLCERHFGTHIKKIISHANNAKKYYQRLEELTRLLKMSSFSSEKLALLLIDEKLETDLLNYLELGVVRLLPENITDIKIIPSILIAHHVVNLSLAESAVQKVDLKIWWFNGLESSFEKLEKLPLIQAHKANAEPSSDDALNMAYDVAHNTFAEVMNSKGWELAKKALQHGWALCSELNDRYDVSTKLALLFSLSESSQEYFKKQHFLKAYEAAYQSLKENNFALSLDEIKATIAKNNWEKEELAKNFYIASLKRMLDGTRYSSL